MNVKPTCGCYNFVVKHSSADSCNSVKQIIDTEISVSFVEKLLLATQKCLAFAQNKNNTDNERIQAMEDCISMEKAAREYYEDAKNNVIRCMIVILTNYTEIEESDDSITAEINKNLESISDINLNIQNISMEIVNAVSDLKN
jgi:hypothetical protein